MGKHFPSKSWILRKPFYFYLFLFFFQMKPFRNKASEKIMCSCSCEENKCWHYDLTIGKGQPHYQARGNRYDRNRLWTKKSGLCLTQYKKKAETTKNTKGKKKVTESHSLFINHRPPLLSQKHQLGSFSLNIHLARVYHS